MSCEALLCPGFRLVSSSVLLVDVYFEQYFELGFECDECGAQWYVKGNGYELPEDAPVCPNGCNEASTD